MKIYILMLVLLISKINFLRCQSTYELFSIPGLNFGIVYSDSYPPYNVSNHSLFYAGDTIIDDKRVLLYRLNTYPIAKHRIYIDGYKVYYLDHGSLNFQLIYDFGAEPGDKLTDIPDKPTVIEKKLIRLQDGRDRIYMKLSLGPQYFIEWVEGIGDIRYSFLSSIYHHSEDLELICVSAGNQMIFEKNAGNFKCDSLICINSVSKFSFTETGKDVQFLNESVFFSKVLWDFGDGKFSEEIHPIHSYESPGCYTVTLTTSSECGIPSKDSKKINFCTKGGWQNTQTLNLPHRAYGIYMLDNNKFWTTSTKSLFFSEDNGLSFVERRFKKTPLTNWENILWTYFREATALVNFSSWSAEGRFNRIYRTNDYGISWTAIKEERNVQLRYSIYNNTIILFNNSTEGVNLFNISEDFGNTWKEHSFQLSGSIRFFHMFDEKTFVVGMSNAVSNDSIANLYLSTDGGQNWTKRDIPFYFDFEPKDINHIYITTPDDKIFLIRDSLRHIQNIVLPYSPEFLLGIKFKDIHHGYVVGSNAIFYTEDGGMSWEERHCHNIDIGQFYVDHNNEFYARNKEKIYRFFPEYTAPECLFSSTKDNNAMNYIKIYPNPVFAGQEIVIDLSGDGSYNIQLTDQLGRIVAKSFIPNKSVSTFYIPNVLPGTYFVRISENETGNLITKLLTIF